MSNFIESIRNILGRSSGKGVLDHLTAPTESDTDAVLFHSGIGNFIMATPFIRNLSDPRIFIPETDHRIEAIKSISFWPVHGITRKQIKSLNGFSRIFALWGWPKKWRKKNDGIFYQPGTKWKEGAFEVDTYLALIPDATPYPARIRADKSAAVEKGENEKLIALSNGGASDWGVKRWPGDRFGKMTQKVKKDHPDTRFVYLGDATEAHIGDSVVNKVGDRCTNLAGKLTFAQSAGVLEGCDLMVTNDTALMHAADALGVKIIALFGPTLWSKNRPASGTATLIQSESGGCPHFPCLHSPERLKCKRQICMETIVVDHVAEIVDAELIKHARNK